MRKLLERSYWFRAHGIGITGWRIFLAASIGPVFWPAWYLAPSWKRDKWHRIACEDVTCRQCNRYYGSLDEPSHSDPEAMRDYYSNLIDQYTWEYETLFPEADVTFH